MAMTGGTAKLLHTGKNGTVEIKLYAYIKSTKNVANNTSDLQLGMYLNVSGGRIGPWTDSGSYIGTASSGTYCKSFTKNVPDNTTGTLWLCENKEISNIAHDSNGKKTVTIYWKFGVNSSWGGFVIPSGSFSFTLPTIPRISTFTVKGTGTTSKGNPYLLIDGNKGLEFTITRNNTAFKHMVTAELGDTKYSSSANITTSHKTPNFSLDNQWLKHIPNASNTYGFSNADAPKATVITYDAAGNKIGSTSKRFDIDIPNNNTTKPAVNLTVAPAHNLADKFADLYIQGVSKARCTVKNTPKFGTKIKACTLTVNSTDYSLGAVTSAVKELPLVKSGTVDIQVSTTDKRGHTRNTESSIDVTPYANPYLEFALCYRCDENGGYTTDGQYLCINCKRVYASVNELNNCSVLLTVTSKHGTVYTSELFANSVSNEFEGRIPGLALDPLKAYSVSLEITDDVGKGKEYIFPIATSFCTFHLGLDGNRAAFGKYAEMENGVEFAFDVYGRALGLGKLYAVMQDDNVNDYTEFGAYSVSAEIVSTIENLPCKVAGKLIVSSATGDGEKSEISQEYISIYGDNYFRLLQNTNDEWIYGQWHCRFSR